MMRGDDVDVEEDWWGRCWCWQSHRVVMLGWSGAIQHSPLRTNNTNGQNVSLESSVSPSYDDILLTCCLSCHVWTVD